MKNFLLIALLFTSFLSACALPDKDKRLENINNINKRDFIKNVYRTTYFEIYSLNKIKNSGKLIIYIEGDGVSWIDRYTISSDPTPIDPLAFKLAKIDENDNVIYLARPCQYINSGNCNNKQIWTVSQYSEAVLSSYREIIDKLEQFNEIHVVGYSGGAGIALYLGSINNKKIKSIRTIAGNINHNQLTKMSNLSPLKGSINFNLVEKKIKNISQIHYFGNNDDVIPNDLHLDFYERNKNSSCIKIKEVNATHHKGWLNFWINENSKIPSCG